MKIKFLLILLIFHHFAISQSMESILDSILKYKYTNTQKAIDFGFKGIELSETDWNKNFQFEYFYQLGEIFTNLNLYIEAIDFMTKSIETYDEISKNSKEVSKNIKLGWVYINIGTIYFKIKKFERAKTYYSDALKIFENYNGSDFEQKNFGLNTSQNNLAMLEIEFENFDKAKSLYEEILKRRLRDEKKSDIIFSYLSLMSLEIQTKNHDQALIFFEKAKEIYQSNYANNTLDDEISLYYSYVLENWGSYQLKMGKFKSALDYLIQSYELTHKINNVNINLIYKIINTYLEINEIKNSELYFAKIEEIYLGLDLNKKINFYKLLEKKYKLLNQTEKIYAIKDSIISLTIKKNDEILNANMNSLDTKLLVRKNQLEFNKKEKSLLQTIYFSIIVILSLVLISTLLFFRYKYIRVKNAKLKIEKQAINNSLEIKKRELLSKTNFIVQRNEYLKKIKHKIEISNHLTKEIKEIKNDISIMLKNEKYYTEFDSLFNELHSKFTKKLKSEYNLSLTYFRLAACIKMNQTNNQIANLCGISLRTVESQRYRLSKLLNLHKGQDLNKFINSL